MENLSVDRLRRRLLLLGAAGAGLALRALAYAPEDVIHVTARRFVFLPNEITLKLGVPVSLELVSADVVMGFNLPDFKLRTDIIPGQVARLRLLPRRTGTFTFLCDVFCGDGHEGMNGRITVTA